MARQGKGETMKMKTLIGYGLAIVAWGAILYYILVPLYRRVKREQDTNRSKRKWRREALQQARKAMKNEYR
jgi:hypothetical protein